jgi:tetratricopeptide (TPR) repeat protein
MFKRPRTWLLAGLVSGLLLIWYGIGLAMWTDQQVMFYNAGLQLYKQGDLENAYKAFELSVTVYKRGQNMTYWQRLIYPKPSAELAALADFQKGKVLIRAQQIPAAVDAFKESLQINPGNGYSGISVDDANRLKSEAYTVKYDLELLFKNNPEQAEKQGKGKPGKGNNGSKPVPGNDPSTAPGKGNRDDI